MNRAVSLTLVASRLMYRAGHDHLLYRNAATMAWMKVSVSVL
jgi:hypothetical protein